MNELMITRRPNRKPTHAGDMLREDVLPAMQMEFDLWKTEQALHDELSAIAA